MNLIFSMIAAVMMIFQNGDLESLRAAYSKANSSTEGAKNFVLLAGKKTSPDPVINGYKAAAQILQAKITTEKNRRKTFVKNGATQLESVIKSNPNTIELRLIRLSIQENLPKIVGYSKNIKEDKSFILNNFSKQNAVMKSYIKNFASQSKSMTASEKMSLK